ncbi:MAG: hypothetical protein HYZ54_12050 [Ignavibacteriae bacterium]|nr:hypothetical protein [Ignavibacteriota bacterium]
MNNHNTSDLLQAFLDGELEQSHEQPLFNELASSGELRNEMRELLAMRSAVQQDIEAFTPPLAATSNIFSTLGFSLPAATSASAVGAGEAFSASSAAATASVASWWGKFWLPSATALIGAGVTFWLLNWGYNSNLNAMASAQSAEIEKIRSEAATQLTNQANSFRSQLQDAQSKVVVQTQKVYVPKIEYRYIDKPVVTDNATIQNENKSVLNTPVEESAPIIAAHDRQPLFAQHYTSGGNSIFTTQNSLHFASPISQDNALVQSHDALTGEILERDFLPQDEQYYQRWSAKFGGVAATITATPTTSLTEPSAAFNDLNLQLMYSTNEEWSFGVRFGREAFPLSYNGTISGRNIERQQYSSVYWGGVVAQFVPTSLSFWGGFQPYFSVFGGRSEIGWLGRTEAGLQYPLSSQFSISAGIDGSGLFYPFQDKSFQTYKSGINTGIIIHF